MNRNERRKKKEGICSICGQFKKLTFEHFPPKSSGNNSSLKVHYLLEGDYETLLSRSDISKNNYVQYQRGVGKHCLCQECNSYLGSAFVNVYINFAEVVKLIVKDSHIIEQGKVFIGVDKKENVHEYFMKLYKQMYSIMLMQLNPKGMDLRYFFDIASTDVDVEELEYDLLFGIMHPFSKIHCRTGSPIPIFVGNMDDGIARAIHSFDFFPMRFAFHTKGNYKGVAMMNFSEKLRRQDYETRGDYQGFIFPISYNDNKFPLLDNRSEKEIFGNEK